MPGQAPGLPVLDQADSEARWGTSSMNLQMSSVVPTLGIKNIDNTIAWVFIVRSGTYVTHYRPLGATAEGASSPP